MSEFEKFLDTLFASARNAGAEVLKLDSGDLGVLFAQSKNEDCEKDGPNPQAHEEFKPSDGLIGVFQLKPREVSAIQFLGSNWTEVLSFLWLHQIPFYSCGSEVDYCGDGGTGRHVHIPGLTGITSSETLSVGRWVYFHGKKGEDDYHFGIYEDEDFRDMFSGEKFGTDSSDPLVGENEPQTEQWSFDGKNFGDQPGTHNPHTDLTNVVSSD